MLPLPSPTLSPSFCSPPLSESSSPTVAFHPPLFLSFLSQQPSLYTHSVSLSSHREYVVFRGRKSLPGEHHAGYGVDGEDPFLLLLDGVGDLAVLALVTV